MSGCRSRCAVAMTGKQRELSFRRNQPWARGIASRGFVTRAPPPARADAGAVVAFTPIPGRISNVVFSVRRCPDGGAQCPSISSSATTAAIRCKAPPGRTSSTATTRTDRRARPRNRCDPGGVGAQPAAVRDRAARRHRSPVHRREDRADQNPRSHDRTGSGNALPRRVQPDLDGRASAACSASRSIRTTPATAFSTSI